MPKKRSVSLLLGLVLAVLSVYILSLPALSQEEFDTSKIPKRYRKMLQNKEPNLFGTVMTARPNSSAIELPYEPLEACEVTIQETKQKFLTDGHGAFYFKVDKPGQYTLLVEKPGFGVTTKTVNVPKGGGAGQCAMVSVILNKGALPSFATPGSTMGGQTAITPGTAYVCLASKMGQGAPAGSSSANKPVSPTTTAYTQMLLLGKGNPFGIANTEASAAQMPMNPTSMQDLSGVLQGPSSSTSPNSIMILNGDSPGNPNFKALTSQPFWATFNAAGTRLYVSTSEKMIQIYDTANENTLLTSIPTGGIVTDLRLAQNGNYVIATIMSAAPTVMLIDPVNNAPQRSIILPRMRTGEAGQPRAAVMNREGTRLFVIMGTSSSGELLSIDTYTSMTDNALAVGANPCGMELSPDGRFIYVANAGSGDVSVVDAWTFQEMGRVRVGVSPQRVAITPDGSKVFITNKGSDNVTILNGQNQSPIATVPVGRGPVGIACTSDGSKVFVTCTGGGNVIVLDGQTGGIKNSSSPMPNSTPWGIAVCP